MKRLFLLLTILTISHFSFGQLKNVELEDSLKRYDNIGHGIAISFQSGIWVPIGKLSKIFNLEPNIGSKLSYPINQYLRLDLGIIFNFPTTSKGYNFHVNDSTFRVKTNSGNAILGLWINHENEIKRSIYFDKYFGIGYGFIGTDLLNKNSRNDKYYDVETVNFNLGLGIRKMFRKEDSFGLFMELNFAPYSLFGRVDDNFGNSYIITGIYYKL
ncbi:MAG: hypothetical protein PHR83_05400 [Paludibacter sp.]|nr:hypothetical protein [Paludibacter sp.]